MINEVGRINVGRRILAKFNALSKKRQSEILEMRCVHRHNILTHPKCFKDIVDLDLSENIGFFDIEATGLKASFGYIFSYSILDKEGKNLISNVITQKEIYAGLFDKRLVSDLCEDLRKFDRVVTFYGTCYDIPFCRTRALLYGEDFPVHKEVLHTDLYYTIKHKLKLHANRLQTACEFFSIPSKGHKLTPHVWQKAQAGDKDSLDYIVTHNKEDVVSTRLLYNKVNDYIVKKNKSI